MVRFPPQAADSSATDNRMPYSLTASPQAACTERGGAGRLSAPDTRPQNAQQLSRHTVAKTYMCHARSAVGRMFRHCTVRHAGLLQQRQGGPEWSAWAERQRAQTPVRTCCVAPCERMGGLRREHPQRSRTVSLTYVCGLCAEMCSGRAGRQVRRLLRQHQARRGLAKGPLSKSVRGCYQCGGGALGVHARNIHAARYMYQS